MATTYQLINSTTLGSNQANITFSTIDSSYTDLHLVASIRTDRPSSATDYLKIGFNGTTSNITYITIEANGSSATSFGTAAAAQFVGEVNSSTSTSNTFSSFSIYIPNYTSSNYKSYSVDSVTENNSSSALMNLTAELWSSTSSITSITLSPGVGSNLVSGTSVYLYGIKNS